MHAWARLILLLAATALAACQSGPRSGPTAGAIDQSGFARYAARPAAADRYVVIEISRAVAAALTGGATKPQTGPQTGPQTKRIAPASSGGAHSSAALGVGDVVQITIYEAETGGLFIAADANGRQGNYLTLPQQEIGLSGTVSVPYAGVIPAAGRTIAALENDIRSRLADRAIEPQIVVSLLNSRSAEISVLGDVNIPSRFSLDPGGNRLLEVLARAGGVRNNDDAATIIIERGATQLSYRLIDVVRTPSDNVALQPGDIIYVGRDHRSFIAFGASGNNGSFAFDSDTLTLSDAIAKAGGLNDARADPGYVYLYREVDRARLLKLGVNLDGHPESLIPVIFHANLRQPAALFATSHFNMEDKDILYISNAEAYDFSKFVNVLGTLTGTASNSIYAVRGVAP